MKIKRDDLLVFLDGLGKMLNVSAPAKFSYALVKNKNKLKSVFKEIKEKEPVPDEAFLEYEKERVEVVSKAAKKDANGDPILRTHPDGSRRYDIEESKMEEVNAEVEKLKEKHKKAMDDMRLKEVEYTKFLDEEIDVDIYTVSMDECPKISPVLMEQIMPIFDKD